MLLDVPNGRPDDDDDDDKFVDVNTKTGQLAANGLGNSTLSTFEATPSNNSCRDALNGLAEESKYSVRLSSYETQERLIGTALKPRGSSALRDYMKMIQEQAIYQSSTEYRRHAIALTRFFSHTQTQFLKTGDLLGGLKPKKVPEHFRRYAWGYLSHAAALYPP